MLSPSAQKWVNRPLRQRLTVFAITLVALAALIISMANIRREISTYNAQIEDQAALFLNTLAYSMRDSLYRLEVDELNDLARVIALEDNFTELRVFDGRGFVIADANVSGLLFSTTADPEGLALLAVPDESIQYSRTPGTLEAGRKIMLGSQAIGALTIGLSTRELDAQIRLMILQSLGLGLLVMGVAAWISTILAAGITQPLNQLAEIATHMSEGQTTVRAIILAEDEVGQLSRAFNHMAGAIEVRERELRDLAQNLEAMVQERTAELLTANTQLQEEIERRKNSEAALVLAKDEALEASRLKTSLLANVSHDLRTPLNIILGYAEILREGRHGSLDERGREMSSAILRSAGQLLNFVNNLLSQAQIESGKLEISNLPFKVQALVENARSISDVLAKSKGLHLTIDVDPEMPAEMVGDIRWINQILYNLITNAIKFTESGGIFVSIAPHDQHHWSVSVRDTGIGISPEIAAQVFEPFFRANDPEVSDIPGSGIGLAIVQQLTKAMGGTLDLKSEPGKGSDFTITLPKDAGSADIL